MPIYVYYCPKTDEHDEHNFELIMPMSECGKPQVCPGHGKECPQVEYPECNWVWGLYEIHWSAGLSSNTHGMNHAKKHGK